MFWKGSSSFPKNGISCHLGLDFSNTKASEVDEVEGAIEGSVLMAFGGKIGVVISGPPKWMVKIMVPTL